MVLPYLKLSFQLRNSQFFLRLYRLTNQVLPTRDNRMLHQPAVFKVSWELTVLPWRLQGFSPWFKTQPQPNCLFESHSDSQVSYQHKALYKLFKIHQWITCGKKFNKYSKIHIFQHSFLVIPFLTKKRWLKKVLQEWVFAHSLGSYESLLYDSILH